MALYLGSSEINRIFGTNAGGGAEWKLIGRTITEEPVSEVAIVNDKRLNEMLVYYSIPPVPADTGGTTYIMPKYIKTENGAVTNLFNVNLSITKPNTKTVRGIWYVTPLFLVRQGWNDSAAIPPTNTTGLTEAAALEIRSAYENGGGVVGFCLNWNLGNKLPAGITLEVWGR